MASGFDASGNIIPSTRPHLLNLHKQWQQLGTKHPNLRACGGHMDSNHHTVSKKIKVENEKACRVNLWIDSYMYVCTYAHIH